MGNCCTNETQEDKERNMNRNAIRGRVNARDRAELDSIPLYLVVRIQAMVRGFLTRRAVKKVFGFEANPSVLRRHTVHIEMDPEKLEEQRARVMEIRDRLPPF